MFCLYTLPIARPAQAKIQMLTTSSWIVTILLKSLLKSFRTLILGSDPLTLEVIINFDIIWHVIFYWFKIGFMTIFCKKFWTFCFSGDFILEEEGTQVFRVHSVFFAQHVQITFLVSMKAAVYFQNFVTKIYNYRNRSSTCPLTSFFWLLSHVIYLKLTRVS